MTEEQTLRERNQQAVKKQRQLRYDEKKQQAYERIGRFPGLTKRNEEYMVHLDKALDEKRCDPAKKQEVLTQMLHELQEKQKQGVTATKLYGTVGERVELILHGPKEKPKEGANRNFWVIALDNGLMMFILFCVMYGFLGIFDKSSKSGGGIISLILISCITGLSLAYFYKVAARTKKNWVRIGLTVVELVAVWLVAFGLISYIPSSINFAMPNYVYIILGVVGIGARVLLKKRFNFQKFPF